MTLPLEGTPEFIERYSGDIDDTGFPPNVTRYCLDLLKRPEPLTLVPPIPENVVFLEDYRPEHKPAA